MRAWVFSEAQIEPALTRWFGSQQLDTDAELALRAQMMAFLTSPEAIELRMRQFEPSNAQIEPTAQGEKLED